MTKRKNSRTKGKVGELELAAVLRGMGFVNAKRGQQFKGGTDSPDIANAITGVHIECKRVEKLDLFEAYAQAARDAGEDKIACVMHRVNRGKWKVTVWAAEMSCMHYRANAELVNCVDEKTCDDAVWDCPLWLDFPARKDGQPRLVTFYLKDLLTMGE